MAACICNVIMVMMMMALPASAQPEKPIEKPAQPGDSAAQPGDSAAGGQTPDTDAAQPGDDQTTDADATAQPGDGQGTGTDAAQPGDGQTTDTDAAQSGDGQVTNNPAPTDENEQPGEERRTMIQGRVVDQQGAPLFGAAVSVQGTTAQAMADDNGNYTLVLENGGTYTIEASLFRFTTSTQTITIEDGQTLSVEFALALDLLDLEETIIVTGTVSGKSKIESTAAVSTLDESYLQKVGARNAADAFKSIPGFYIESSGGQGNANLMARGLPHSGGGKFTQIQEDGLEIVQYGDIMFGNTDIWLRLDPTVERIEGIRGGSASIAASNAPGGIINVISKTGGVAGGSIAQSIGLTYNHTRLDAEYGSPITENLRFHIGGFYRTDDGVRSPGFTANKGGQIKANLTRTFKGGYIRGYFKYLNDRSIAYLPIPLARANGSDDPEGIPGFDPNYGTMHSRDLLRLHATTPHGTEVNESLDAGMNPNVTAFGIEAEYDFSDGWTITERFRKSYLNGQFNSIFSFSGSPLGHDEFAQSLGLTDYSYSFVSGPGAGDPISQERMQNLNQNGLVVPYGWWAVDIPLENFTNKIELSKKFRRDDMTVDTTLGYYHNHNILSADWWWHNVLTDVSDNSRRLDLIDNTTGQSVTTDGVLQYGTLYRSYWADTRIDAPYLNVDVSPIKPLTVVAGLRYDMGRIRGATEKVDTFDYDVNGDGIITAAEQDVQYGTGEDIPFNYWYQGLSYSMGANYLVNKDNAVFFGHSMGRRAPADRTFAFNATDDTHNGFPPATKLERIFQTELGYKFRAPGVAVFATAFLSNFPDYSFTDLRTNPATGQVESVTEFSSVRALGLELETLLSYRGLSLLVTGTVQNTAFTGFTQTIEDENGDLVEVDYSGNAVPGAPAFYYVLRPSYDYKGIFDVGLTIQGNTKKWLDNGNTQKLSGFTQVNASASYNITKRMSLLIVASNIFNTIGLTEGNPRAVQLTPAGNLFFARPILGRSAVATLRYTM